MIAVSDAAVRVERVSEVRVDDAGTRALLRIAADDFRAHVPRAGQAAGLTLSSEGLRVQWVNAWAYAIPASDERVYLLQGRARATFELSGHL